MAEEKREYVGEVSVEELVRFVEVQRSEEAMRRVMADFQWAHMENRKRLMNEQHGVWESLAARLNLDIKTTNYNIEVMPDGTSQVFTVKTA